MRKIIFLAFLLTQCIKVYSQPVASGIFNACRTGDLQTVKTLYKQNPDILNSSNHKGYTPLILSVYNHQSEVVTFLLAQKVNANAQDKSGNTALMGAVFKGHIKYVKQLIAEGAKVDQKNYNGATALTFAATFGKTKIARILLKKGAKPLLPDARGKSPMDYSKMQENAEITALFEKHLQKK